MDRPWELTNGSTSLGKLFRIARRESKSLLSRLRSLSADTSWLSASLSLSPAASALPHFANLRAGAWYAPPPSPTFVNTARLGPRLKA